MVLPEPNPISHGCAEPVFCFHSFASTFHNTTWCIASNVQAKVFNSMQPTFKPSAPLSSSWATPTHRSDSALDFITPLNESRTVERTKIYAVIIEEDFISPELVISQTCSLAFLHAHSWSPHECRVACRSQFPAASSQCQACGAPSKNSLQKQMARKNATLSRPSNCRLVSRTTTPRGTSVSRELSS
jgi:hypothetical protein